MDDDKDLNVDPGTEKAQRGNQQRSGTSDRAKHVADEERARQDRKVQGTAGRQKSKERSRT